MLLNCVLALMYLETMMVAISDCACMHVETFACILQIFSCYQNTSIRKPLLTRNLLVISELLYINICCK